MTLEIPTTLLPAIYLTKDKVAETIADLDKVSLQKSWPFSGAHHSGMEPLKCARKRTKTAVPSCHGRR